MTDEPLPPSSCAGQDLTGMSEAELRAFAEGLQRDHVELRQQHEALQAALDRERGHLEHAPIGALLLDDEGRIEAVNERAAELLGASPQALQGTPLAEWLHPEAQAEWLACHRSFSPEMSRCSVTLRLQHPDGVEQAVLAEAAPEPSAHASSAARYRVVLVDVTGWHRTLQQLKETEAALRQREQALEEREAHYRDLVENHPFLAARFLPDTTITFANRTLAAFFDTEPERLEGLRWLDLYDSAERESFQRHLAAFTPQAPLQEIEHPVTGATGELRWVRWTNRAFFDANGELTHFQGVGLEVTEQREAEQALRKSERRFRQMAESIDEVFLLRAGNELLYISPACERVLGYPQEAFYPHFSRFLEMVHPDDRERLRASALDNDATGEPIDLVYRIVRPDGEVRWLHGHGYTVHDEHDGTLLRVGTARDVTAYKTLQHQLEATSRAKSGFLNAVSHDLRTPLNALIGFTDLLAQSSLDAEQRHHLCLCQGAAQRLLGLIDTLLDLARLQSGKVAVDQQPVVLRSFLKEQLGMMQARAAEKGLTLGWHVDPALPAHVETDPNRLAQVLFNLVGNAIAYTEEGGVEVAVEHDGPDRARATVQDTGPGIPLEQRQQIFEPFERGGHEARREHNGLGLTVVRELVHLLGGDIELDSKPGEGSTFIVTLDLPAASAEAPAAAEAEPAGTETAERPGEGLRVLAAEDDTTNALLIQSLLERAGCTVEVVADGEAALAAWGQNQPDLVLLDLEMPQMDGYQVARAVREREVAQGARRTPLAALTAHALEETRQACYAAGFDTHLSKPVGWRVIAQLLDWARQPREQNG